MCNCAPCPKMMFSYFFFHCLLLYPEPWVKSCKIDISFRSKYSAVFSLDLGQLWVSVNHHSLQIKDILMKVER